EYVSALRVPLGRNKVLIGGVFAALGLHLLSMQLPFMQSLLRVAPVSFAEFGILFALALSVLLVMEIFKLLNAQRTERQALGR
ncbi:MAG TPA: cation-translocating P-type ATPase C-terminal domain-containing protein, partial [Roseiflexaceae bacterium]|nr:cation-translocating P-type ATPase C-terminal domain-containing protein [Roseiflexaceae bacterium]